jgi:hypothetical protein
MDRALAKRLNFRQWFRLFERQSSVVPESRSSRQPRGSMAAAMTTAATAATAFATGGAGAITAEAPTERPKASSEMKSPDGLPAVPGRWRLVARNGTSTDYRVTEHHGTLYVCDGCRMSLAVPLRKLEGDWIPIEISDR